VLVALASAGASWKVWTIVHPGSCQHLMATVRTNKLSYAPGQTVIITVTQANEGPVCIITTPPCGPARPAASAYNAAGRAVWVYGVGKTINGPPLCFPGPVSATLRAHSSDTEKYDWSQDECTLGPGLVGHQNPDCPGTQVPAGTYRIVGGNGPSASVTITISG